MKPSELPEHYFASVTARDIDRFISLFAEDAVMILPNGQELAGAPAIREMEKNVFDTVAMTPTLRSIIADEKSVVAEIDVGMPDGTSMKLANIYHLNDQGLIQRLSGYRKTN